MNLSVETILQYTIAAGFLAIIYGYFTGKQILSASSGNSKGLQARTEHENDSGPAVRFAARAAANAARTRREKEARQNERRARQVSEGTRHPTTRSAHRHFQSHKIDTECFTNNRWIQCVFAKRDASCDVWGH